MRQPDNAGATIRTFEDLQFAAVIAAIGTKFFEGELINFLHERFGADNCVIYQFGAEELRSVGLASYSGSAATRDNICRYITAQNWRRDPTIMSAQGALTRIEPVLFRQDPRSISDAKLRGQLSPRLAERIVVCGGRFADHFGFSVSRSLQNQMFSTDHVVALERAADALLASVSRHAQIIDRARSSVSPLASMTFISNQIKQQKQLSQREIEVCAGILHGHSIEGIAAMLRVGRESVATYRKRAYGKLGIGSKHELISWYLSL